MKLLTLILFNMTDVRQIIAMCKAGNIQAAYDLAQADKASMPTYPWVEEGVGWAIYYRLKADRAEKNFENFSVHLDEFYALKLLVPDQYKLLHTLVQRERGWGLYSQIKEDSEKGNYHDLLAHIDKLKTLDLLDMTTDSMLYDNVQLQVAVFVKKYLPVTDLTAHAKLSVLFSKLRDFSTHSTIGHSSLLQAFIKFENWPEMADFLDWWNLDYLSAQDYTPYINQKGQKMMTLAERAFIAKSKALLKLNDLGRIEEFLPELDKLMNDHGEMMYLGYFYGKLLLALGSDADEALKVIIPFARKKVTEFWVWQLLSDVFTHDEEKQLACLLRAVHCRTQESFLGKVHIKLAACYIHRQQLNAARYHIDAVIRCYGSQRWRLPHEVEEWTHQPWFHSATPDGRDPIDYRPVTDAILCEGAEECVAVVTYVDPDSHKSFLIYGREKRMVQKLRCKVQVGNVLKLHYVQDKNGRMKVLTSAVVQLPDKLDYAKCVEGIIDKKDEKEFAFLRAGSISCFVAPRAVQKYNLKGGDSVKSLVVYDYDKKKDAWNWACVKIWK